MGIILPTLLVVLLIGIPYIDRNPYRSLYKRPIAVGVGLFFVAVLLVLSYMGLPQYGIETPAATRIIQDLAPEEGIGPLRAIPFDELQTGVYEVGDEVPRDLCPNLDFGCPALTGVFREFSERVTYAATTEDLENYQRLPNADAVMVIEDWQDGLKKVTLRISWDDPVSGERQTYEKHYFVHRDRERG
jgi:hypothetical protein